MYSILQKLKFEKQSIFTMFITRKINTSDLVDFGNGIHRRQTSRAYPLLSHLIITAQKGTECVTGKKFLNSKIYAQIASIKLSHSTSGSKCYRTSQQMPLHPFLGYPRLTVICHTSLIGQQKLHEHNCKNLSVWKHFT